MDTFVTTLAQLYCCNIDKYIMATSENGQSQNLIKSGGDDANHKCDDNWNLDLLLEIVTNAAASDLKKHVVTFTRNLQHWARILIHDTGQFRKIVQALGRLVGLCPDQVATCLNAHTNSKDIKSESTSVLVVDRGIQLMMVGAYRYAILDQSFSGTNSDSIDTVHIHESCCRVCMHSLRFCCGKNSSDTDSLLDLKLESFGIETLLIVLETSPKFFACFVLPYLRPKVRF